MTFVEALWEIVDAIAIRREAVQFGDKISDKPCTRCHQRLGDCNISYQDGMWYHTPCLREGQRLLANATRLATSINGEIIPPSPSAISS